MTRNFHRPIAAVIFVLVIMGAAISFGAESDGLSLVNEFEGGRLYRTVGGHYLVGVFRGGWRTMGRQYGGLMAENLRAFYSEITADIAARGMPIEKQLAEAHKTADGYPDYLRELIAGMVETTGMSYDQILTLNVGMMNLTNVVLGGEPPSACSGAAAWQSYTPDGRLVFGRNWDINRAAMQRYMKYLGVAVFNTNEGYSLANVHPWGNIYLETGMNEKGLFLELNNGEYSDPTDYPDRIDTSVFLIEVLNACRTTEEAAKMMLDRPADLSYIIQAADPNGAVSVERATFGGRVLRGKDGFLAAYNCFAPPYPADWEGRVAPPIPTTQDPRYKNLLALAETYKGKLDPEGMIRLLAVKIEDGGALHDGTVVQVVALPAELTLWIRGVDFSDFEKVQLAELFAD